MLEAHLRAETAFLLVQHIVDVIDARHAVVPHFDLGDKIIQEIAKILDLKRFRNDIFVDVHRILVGASLLANLNKDSRASSLLQLPFNSWATPES
jgi:hypothetical protein